MEVRAGNSVELVADQSAQNAASSAFQQEMKDIGELESSEASAKMECLDEDLGIGLIEDLGIGLMSDSSPSLRTILESDHTITEGLPVEDDDPTPKRELVTQRRKDSVHFSHTKNPKARKRLSKSLPCKTRKGMSCAVDTAWQKRGFDSLTSHTFFMSKYKYGKKVVKTVVKHRTCGVCKWWRRNRKGMQVRPHRCVGNHTGSARMMESVSGEQGLEELNNAGTPVEIIEGDGDSTFMARVRDKFPYLKKRYDKNHIVKNVGKSLYALQASKKQN